MIVGFTGSRDPLPSAQKAALERLLYRLDDEERIAEGHHGDCIEGDMEFDRWCRSVGIERHAHPGPDGPNRARSDAQVIYAPQPFLVRNRDIVDACDVMVSCPSGPERQRSGTWATVRYARKLGRRLIVVWPDGHVDE